MIREECVLNTVNNILFIKKEEIEEKNIISEVDSIFEVVRVLPVDLIWCPEATFFI